MTKMTEKEMYTMIAEKMSDNADVVAFCAKKVEQLSRKRSDNSKAKAETEARMEKVYEALAEMDKAVQVSELVKLTSIEEVASWNGQRITALLSKLVKAGRVVREEVKGKAFYAIA